MKVAVWGQGQLGLWTPGREELWPPLGGAVGTASSGKARIKGGESKGDPGREPCRVGVQGNRRPLGQGYSHR